MPPQHFSTAMTTQTDNIESAVHALQQGQVIAYPTEAVYGLGCDPDNEQAISKILELKHRPAEKGLILIAADFAQLEKYLLPLSADELARCQSTWPGPVTWIIPKSDRVSPLLSGAFDSIAVRVTAHPVASELCTKFGKPVVSTSANLSGQEPARSIADLEQQFSERIPCMIEGPVDLDAKPSEIRDLKTNNILRGS